MGAFDRQAALALHGGPGVAPWLQPARLAARGAWLGAAWPTRKTEAWKYTTLEALEARAWLGEPPPAVAAGAAGVPGLDAELLVFRNGRFDAEASRFAGADGVTLARFDDAGEAAGGLIARRLGTIAAGAPGPFAALAGCWTRDGVLLHVGRGVRAPRPVCIVHEGGAEAAGSAWAQRLLVLLEPGAECSVVELFRGEGGFVSGLTEIALGEGARLGHRRLQLEGEGAAHVGGVHVEIARAASYAGFVFARGSCLKRVDLRVRHRGEGSEAVLDGVYLARRSQLVDLHTDVLHELPRGTTRQVYRGIVDDEARAVFNGRILIERDAQQTSADLSNRNLLFSNRAEVDTKPELEIYADDVRCSHGATVSRIDPKGLYYLRSRGIARAEAEVLLACGFVGELLEAVPEDGVRALLSSELRGWVAGGASAGGLP